MTYARKVEVEHSPILLNKKPIREDGGRKMFDDILVGFDGSNTSRRAAEEAMDLAEETGAEIHFIEVIDITAFSGRIDWKNVIDRIELKSSEALQDKVDEARDRDIFAGKRVTRGIPHEGIIHRSEEIDADLIALGKKGRTGAKNILGSTTERVLEKTEKPVLAVT